MTNEMALQLKGYGLTTAQILYRMPEPPLPAAILCLAALRHRADFPEMKNFLKFWQEKLDGPLHSVRYTHRKLISATEWRGAEGRNDPPLGLETDGPRPLRDHAGMRHAPKRIAFDRRAP